MACPSTGDTADILAGMPSRLISISIETLVSPTLHSPENP
jgi:hypothetical protein